MSDYNKSTNFTTKDTLPTGNSQKLVKGTELDIEFTNIASAVASKANSDSPNLTGTPTAPTATSGSNTTQLANTAFVSSALATLVPSGVITLWSGSIASIPFGWLLCNGASGTPDLRDRFVVGAGSSYAVGATGGANTVALDTTMIPSHTHSISGSGTTSAVSNDHTHTFSGTSSGTSNTHTHGVSDPGHNHAISYSSAINLDVGGIGALVALGSTNTSASTTGISLGNASADHTHTYSGTTSGISANHTHTWSFSGTSGATGSGAAHENRPPYYALAYIMKS